MSAGFVIWIKMLETFEVRFLAWAIHAHSVVFTGETVSIVDVYIPNFLRNFFLLS